VTPWINVESPGDGPTESGEVEELVHLSRALLPLLEQQELSVSQLAAEDLLAAQYLRLLVPCRVERSSAWEDLPPRAKRYRFPEVVRQWLLLLRADGRGDPEDTLRRALREGGWPFWSQAPRLMRLLKGASVHGTVEADALVEIARQLEVDPNLLILGLKAVGAISPQLSDFQAIKRGVPRYQLHPLLELQGGP